MAGESPLAQRVPDPAGLAVGEVWHPPSRERLGHEQERVARDEEVAQATLTARTPLARVARDGRLVTTAPSGQAQAQCQVDVLEISEVALVKTSHANDGSGAIQRRAGTRAEHLPRRVEATVIGGEATALLTRPVAAQDVAGVVDLRPVVEDQHFAGHRSCLGVVVQRATHALQPIGLYDDVGVEQRDKRGAGKPNAPVDGVGETRVAGQGHDPHPRVLVAQVGQRIVSGAVVDDDHLGRQARLGREGLQTVGQPPATVPVRDDH